MLKAHNISAEHLEVYWVVKEVFGQMKKNCLMYNKLIFIIYFYS